MMAILVILLVGMEEYPLNVVVFCSSGQACNMMIGYLRLVALDLGFSVLGSVV
jgi:hypothetical protein